MADRQRQITEMREEVIRQVREEITRLVREEGERQQTGDQANGQNANEEAGLRASLHGLAQDMAQVAALIQMMRRDEDGDRGYHRYGDRVQFPRRFPSGGYGV